MRFALVFKTCQSSFENVTKRAHMLQSHPLGCSCRNMCSLLLKRARHYLNSIRCGLAFCQGPGELEAHAKGATARTFPYPDATPSQVATLCVATRLRRHALRPLPVSGPRQEWVPATDAPTHHRLRRQALRSLPVSGPRQEWVVTRDITDCEA